MRFWILLATATLCGCVKLAPAPETSALPPDAGPTEAERFAPRVDAFEKEVASTVEAVDLALWQHWTAGTPLALEPITQAHATLLNADQLRFLEQARAARPQDTERIDALSHWLSGELLARALVAESEVVANVEASATFTLDGKELLLRDLPKLLVSERSAVKRRSLWTASHAAALRLDAALAHREGVLRATLEQWGLPSSLDLALQNRGLDAARLHALADETLTATEAEWKTTLQTLSDGDVKLPITALTRGDLPRLLKVSPAVDVAFPKNTIATRAVQTLGTVGVYGKPGLTLDLSEAAKKLPLPLTVAPTPADVRVSVRPLGGLRDQQSVLGELGAALELHRRRDEPFFRARLTSTADALVMSELFSTLVSEPEWLTAQGVVPVTSVSDAAKAQRLYQLRRTAGVVLARLDTEGVADETDARARYVQAMSRALGITLPAEEGARWRVDTEDFLRSASQLTAMTRADAWRAQLGAGWWLKPVPAPPH